jgi:O-acetylserine/cysteine efflux transporter
MLLISLAKEGVDGAAYPLLIAITALAPLCWSVYSVVSKPMAGRVPPIVWTYLTIALGGLLTLPLMPTTVWGEVAALDAPGWGAVLYLAVPCTVLGYALWNWLLRFLPASTVGFTVFLNPPLTTASKFLLAAWLPATFAFAIRPLEWAGGVVTLAGLAIAVREATQARTGSA